MRITLKELKKIVKQTINESFDKNVPGFYLVIDEKIHDTRYESAEAAREAAAEEELWAQGIKIVNITGIITVK